MGSSTRAATLRLVTFSVVYCQYNTPLWPQSHLVLFEIRPVFVPNSTSCADETCNCCAVHSFCDLCLKPARRSMYSFCLLLWVVDRPLTSLPEFTSLTATVCPGGCTSTFSWLCAVGLSLLLRSFDQSCLFGFAHDQRMLHLCPVMS